MVNGWLTFSGPQLEKTVLGPQTTGELPPSILVAVPVM
jgi:hypothetical protein